MAFDRTKPGMTRMEAETFEPLLRGLVLASNGWARRHTIEDLDKSGTLLDVLLATGWSIDYRLDVIRAPETTPEPIYRRVVQLVQYVVERFAKEHPVAPAPPCFSFRADRAVQWLADFEEIRRARGGAA